MQFARKFGIILLLAAMALFILVQTGIFGGDTPSPRPNNAHRPSTNTISEPRFRHDGDLWITDATSNDTLAALKMETAKSQEEIQYGMMFRKGFSPEYYGMLFFMREEKMQSFWMRNTYVSLDIVYINSDNEIVSIVHDAEPLSDTSLPSEGPALYVLELPGGYTAANNIGQGDIVNWSEIPI